MEYEKCHILDQPEERPAKKRKVNDTSLESSWAQRSQLYHNLWSRQEERINDVLERTNQETLDNILNFLDRTEPRTCNSPIVTGIISGGPDLSSQETLVRQLAGKIQNTRNQVSFACLSSRDAFNLKNILKILIQRATSQNEGADDAEDESVIRRRGSRLLNYDLQILQDWMVEHRVAKVVLAFEDVEAFDTALLSEVIDVLSASSITFSLLFSVATSVENFQERLPRATIRKLQGQNFNAIQANEVLEQVFEVTIDDAEQRLWLGPGLCGMLFDRQMDHFQSVQAFIDAVKYAHMSHFYANPLSLFMQRDLTIDAVPKDHFEATRNLQSFRRYAEISLEEGKIDLVRALIGSDQRLFQSVMNHMASGTDRMKGIVRTLKLLRKLRASLQLVSDVSLSSLYIKAISGELNGSPFVRDLLLLCKKASSDTLTRILNVLNSPDEAELSEAAKQMMGRLNRLVASNNKADEPLRSEHDIGRATLRTTIVAQKVELSKQKSSLTKQDNEYSKIVHDLNRLLEDHFKTALVGPQKLFMQEVFVYDIKGPHRDTFMPRPRFVIERALCAPHDYLNCHCCQHGNEKEDEPIMLPSNPPTSIMYQLYLESGALINVGDLYSAFNAMVAKENTDERSTMALFQRALAELKYMGFLKSSRKKMDHVAKLAWKGL